MKVGDGDWGGWYRNLIAFMRSLQKRVNLEFGACLPVVIAKMKWFLILLAVSCVFAGCATRSPTTLRVMSYNIHHGEGMDGKVDLERIAGIIMQEGVDIVALQEVDRGVERSGRRDIPEELAKLTGMRSFFDRNITFQGGDYGNAVLTRFPVLQQTNTHLRMLRPNEQRGVIQMVLKVQGRKLLFLNTHIDHRPDDSERLKNVEQFQQILEEYPGMPVIFCGDFNSIPGSRTHTQMKRLLIDSWEEAGQGNGFTFPADKLNRRIDYLWISPGSVKPLKIHVPQTLASDHLPLVGTFQID